MPQEITYKTHCTQAILIVLRQEEHYIDFKLERAIAWCPDTDEVLEKEFYLEGKMKWDGCSHVYFKGPCGDGYYHMCGLNCWQFHAQIVEWLYKQLTTLMDNKQEAGDWQ